LVPIQPENAVIPYVKGFPKYEANLFINDYIPVKYENDQQKTNQCGSLSRGYKVAISGQYFIMPWKQSKTQALLL